MKIIKYISFTLILLFVIAILTFKNLTVNIPPGKVGVRTAQYAVLGKKGIIDKDFGPGWHRNFGPLDKWILFDSTVQTIEMCRNHDSNSKIKLDPLVITTANGNKISLDISIKYRMMPDSCYKFAHDNGDESQLKKLLSKIPDICLGVFGKMKPNDFFHSETRITHQEEAFKELKEELAKNYIEPVDLLIRNIYFEKEYDKTILKNIIAKEENRFNIVKKELTEKEGITNRIAAETEQKIMLIMEENEKEKITRNAQNQKEISKIIATAKAKSNKIKADADLYLAKKSAEGQLAIKKAEAEGERLRNEAMAGQGGTIMAALEAARNIKISEITISTMQMDLLNLDKMLERLGLEEEK